MPEHVESPDNLRWEQAMANAHITELVDVWEWHTLPGYRPARKRKPRKPRTPSIRARIAAAEKAGKTVTSVTLPDGTVLQFGEPSPAEASNPWLADIAKLRKQ